MPPIVDLMEAQSTDPRDGRWRQDATAYRVDFWRPLGGLAPRELGIGVMFASDEWLLTGVRDVVEAIAWADANADGRTYTLYAVLDRGGDARGLILLRGIDPTRGHVGHKHKAEVERLFAAHGYSGVVKMVPVVAADERVFVLPPLDLARLVAPEDLVAALERYLEAPVRLVEAAGQTVDQEPD
jgi:hypothetical protein